MFYWIYDLPLWAGAMLFVVVFVGISWLLVVTLHPWVHHLVRHQPDWANIISSVLSAYGVLYGITLALVVVAAYQDYVQAGGSVALEAAALGTLYRDVSSYPEPSRIEFQNMLRDYARDVSEKDWPAQQRGVVPEGGTAQTTAFHTQLLAFQPSTPAEEIVHAETLREFSTFVEYRRLRLYSVTVALPVILWVVMIVGALLSMMLVALFDIKRLRIHLAVSAILSFFVSLLLYLAVALDNPFRGGLSVSPRAFEIVAESLMR